MNNEEIKTLRTGYEGGTMVSEDLGGKITLHYQSAAEADNAFDVLSKFLEATPAAASAGAAGTIDTPEFWTKVTKFAASPSCSRERDEATLAIVKIGAQAFAAADRKAREDVARALGLPVSGMASFAWSYLLTQIEECVKCEEELSKLRAATAPVSEATQMSCSTCGADRLKERCKAEHWQRCPMTGEAHSALSADASASEAGQAQGDAVYFYRNGPKGEWRESTALQVDYLKRYDADGYEFRTLYTRPATQPAAMDEAAERAHVDLRPEFGRDPQGRLTAEWAVGNSKICLGFDADGHMTWAVYADNHSLESGRAALAAPQGNSGQARGAGQVVAWACWPEGCTPTPKNMQLCDYEPMAYKQRRALTWLDAATAPQAAELPAMTDTEIIEIWNAMPGGPKGFGVFYGCLQFARDVLHATAAKQAGKAGEA